MSKLQEPDNKEKVVTRYDQKMEKRKALAEKEKKLAVRNRVIGILVALCLVVGVGTSIFITVKNRIEATSGVFAKVGEYEITNLEYEYYYNTVVNNYVNSYSSFLSYMGLDVNTPFSEQMYDETMTWKDAFDAMAMTQIQQTKAMIDDAKANGFEYDVTEDYNTFIDNFTTQAETAGVTISNYYKDAFGAYATASNVKSFIEDTLFISAYYDSIVEANRPSDEEVAAYYEENKNNYDLVDYHSLAISADVADDATEEEIAEALAQVEERAQEMADKVLAGEDFQTLCAEYANEDAKETYTTEESDPSLFSNYYYSYTPTAIASWVFDAERIADDVTVITDTNSSSVYVVKFLSRVKQESADQTISNTLAGNVAMEYQSSLYTTGYEIVDVAGSLHYLTIPEATGETEETENTDTNEDTTETENTDTNEDTTEIENPDTNEEDASEETSTDDAE